MLYELQHYVSSYIRMLLVIPDNVIVCFYSYSLRTGKTTLQQEKSPARLFILQCLPHNTIMHYVSLCTMSFPDSVGQLDSEGLLTLKVLVTTIDA